ncbi:MAG: LysR family transcriptional regulator [Proteobacteria bacterium]|nr:LysR family transcriptional regulator [Pseudomonadota bacterium]
MDITFRQLQYFVALVDHRSFSAAAEASAITQPNMSHQIKQLEEALGFSLIERQRKHFLVTPEGQEVYTRARQMLTLRQELTDFAHTVGKPLEGRLNVGVIPTIGPYLLPQVVAAVRKDYPHLQLALTEAKTHELLDMVAEGKLDIAFLALPVDGTDGMRTLAVAEEPFMVALPNGHALLKKSGLTVEDILGERLLLLADGHCLRDHALEVCHRAGKVPGNVDFSATSLETLKQMVAQGAGITLLPACAARRASEEGYTVRPVVGSTVRRQLGLAWRASSLRRKEFELLGTTFGKAIG